MECLICTRLNRRQEHVDERHRNAIALLSLNVDVSSVRYVALKRDADDALIALGAIRAELDKHMRKYHRNLPELPRAFSVRANAPQGV